MSDAKPEYKPGPPIGTFGWYSSFFDKLERVKVDNVDKKFITDNKIAPENNATSVISGLKFLNLIKEDGSATDKIKSLDIVGPDYQKNLEIIVHEAYSILFNKIKKLNQSQFEDILNCFKLDYNMAPSTAQQATSIFIGIAQRAGIKLSEQILERSKPVVERNKSKQESSKTSKTKRKKVLENKGEEQLPETVLARLTLTGTGHVDIKSKDDLEIAEAMWKALHKKLATT